MTYIEHKSKHIKGAYLYAPEAPDHHIPLVIWLDGGMGRDPHKNSLGKLIADGVVVPDCLVLMPCSAPGYNLSHMTADELWGLVDAAKGMCDFATVSIVGWSNGSDATANVVAAYPEGFYRVCLISNYTKQWDKCAESITSSVRILLGAKEKSAAKNRQWPIVDRIPDCRLYRVDPYDHMVGAEIWTDERYCVLDWLAGKADSVLEEERTTMNTKPTLRQQVVDAAVAWLGRKESDGSHKEIIDVYNSQRPLPRNYAVTYSDPWCATFVSAVAIRCGITDILPTECSCYYMIELFKKLGTWHEADDYWPEPGDVVFYDWQDNGVGDNTGTPDHVGLVHSVSGNTIQVIEGNADNAVVYRQLQINGKYIRGYGLPKYSAVPEPEPVAKSYTITVSGTMTYADESEAEKAAAAINSLGFIASVKEITAAKEIRKGDSVRVKRGAKFYDGEIPIPVVYDRIHKVNEIIGNRAVISCSGIIVGAVHKDNLIVVM